MSCKQEGGRGGGGGERQRERSRETEKERDRDRERQIEKERHRDGDGERGRGTGQDGAPAYHPQASPLRLRQHGYWPPQQQRRRWLLLLQPERHPRGQSAAQGEQGRPRRLGRGPGRGQG